MLTLVLCHCSCGRWELLDDPRQNSLCSCCDSTCKSRPRRGVHLGISSLQCRHQYFLFLSLFLFIFLHFVLTMSLKMSFSPTFFLRIPGIQPQICFGTTDHCGSVWFDGFNVLQFDSMKSLLWSETLCFQHCTRDLMFFFFFLSRQEILVWPDGHYDLHNKMPRSRLLWPPHQQDVEMSALCDFSWCFKMNCIQ